MNIRCILPAALLATCLLVTQAAAQGIDQLQHQAEAHLQNVELEQALKLFRRILELDSDHARAKLVVSRLTAQALDLDSHLAVLAGLLDRNLTDGLRPLLDAAAARAATDAQKARITYLRGRLSAVHDNDAEARTHYTTAMKLYPATEAAVRATIALALADRDRSDTAVARQRLRRLIEARGNDKLAQEARFHLTMIESQHLSEAATIGALEALLAELSDSTVKRMALNALITERKGLYVHWVPQSVDAMAAIFMTDPPADEVAEGLKMLLDVAATSQDPATLDRLLVLLDDVKFADPHHSRQAVFVRVSALLSRAVVHDQAAAVHDAAAEAHRVLDHLAGSVRTASEQQRVTQLRGRAYLVEGQKQAVLAAPIHALPLLTQAIDLFLDVAEREPTAAFDRLQRIGTLLEQLRQWEMAVVLYRRIADRFGHLVAGRDALLRIAQIHETQLGAPMAALDAYADYAARYPAELPYRQLPVGKRLQRLGYANVLDFQKRNDLAPDGVFGPISRRRLERLERGFDLIAAPADDKSDVLRGSFVHPAVFAIARRLEKAGQHRDAIIAYRMLLNLFPTKKQADDALLAIARLLRANLLFPESLGAYRQLITDYPKGDKTSLAYIEQAACLENLGRWPEARDLYELYSRKFPKYKHVGLCRQRLDQLDQLLQYEDFIRTNPENPKVAEAQYQIAAILYRDMKNYTKAAMEFTKVADAHPAHVRAADALFTAGTAQLRAENFSAARTLFTRLLEGYPDSRLADDAQFWIGHTHEYTARALGKLDEKRIVLRTRTLRSRAEVASDLNLRRHYNADVGADDQVAEQFWGGDGLGVLTAGSIRDRVNSNLFRAIRAYRKVVDAFKIGDMAGRALQRIGAIYIEYLDDRPKGIAAYRELLAHHPGAKEAVDALFDVCAYQIDQGQYDQAITSYQQFLYNYPNHQKVQDAMIGVARGHVGRKAWDKALDAFQAYLNKYPDGRFKDLAKTQVDWIRMYHF